MRVPRLVGNNRKATILIGVFVLILVGLLWKCSLGAEFILKGGATFGYGGGAPALGLDIRFPQDQQIAFFVGTMLWGESDKAETNWDWHGGFTACRGRICASLGAAYLQRIDALNGSHANFALGVSYRFDWHRIEGIDYFHLSNAGTVMPNYGRNAALVSVRLR